MNDLSDTAPPKRRRASRKAAKPVDTPAGAPPEAAVRAILEHALQPDAEARAEVEVESALAEVSSAAGSAPSPAPSPAPAKPRRAPRKRGKSAKAAAAPLPQPEMAAEPDEDPVEAAVQLETVAEIVAMTPAEVVEAPETWGFEAPAPIEAGLAADGFAEAGPSDVQSEEVEPGEVEPTEADHYNIDHYQNEQHDGDRAHDHLSHADGTPPGGHHAPPPSAPPPPSHHHWVYLGLGVFLLALGFGVWGAWAVFFSGEDASSQTTAAVAARSEKLSQEVSTLRRSDQISRDANRDLERTLAERDEEIAGLRADIAFYESFVGATGQRRGLSVHDLDMQLQGGDAWHFVATLTQNLNRGAVNTGRVTLSIEGTRNDRLEKLTWSGLRKQNNAPGVAYSFKYFQQVEGEVLLPKGFKPLRVGVRLVPAGGSAVEQSFPWPDTVRSDEGG